MASEIVQNPSVHVFVLIEANWQQVLETTQVVSNEAAGSYTYKTKLEWCIVRPTSQQNDDRSLKRKI